MNGTYPSRLPREFHPGGRATILLSLSGTLALLVSLNDLGHHADSPTVFANALGSIWLGISLAFVVSGRRLGLGRMVLTGWIFLGCLRALSSLFGYPVGWTLSETIEVGNKTSTSETLTRELQFPAGAVPAHLINDNYKFNFRGDRDEDPNRATLPVALAATTYVAGEGTLIISSSSPIQIVVDSETSTLSPPIVDFERRLSLSKEEPLRILFASTPVDKAALSVQVVGVQPYASRTAGSLMTVRRLLGKLSGFLDLAVVVGTLLMLAYLVRRCLTGLTKDHGVKTGLVTLAILLSLAPHLITWYFQHDSLLVLSGGDDWLTYETFARDIRDNSLLMLGGHTVGNAAPFYYQPLYPYIVAAGHLILGESVQAIVLMQLVWVAAVLALAVASSAEGVFFTAVLLVVLFGTGVVNEWTLQAHRLLSENLLILLFALLIFVISRIGPVPRLRSLALVGVLLGVAGITRSTAWVAVPFLLVLLLRHGPKRELGIRLVAVILPILALAALIPVRNVIATGQPVLFPTSGAVNLYLGNVPGSRKLTTEPWIEWSTTYDPRLVAVAEAIVDAPDQVSRMVADKAIYVLGFPRSMDSDNPPIFWPVLSLWLLAPLGALTSRHSRVEWSCLALALTHVLSLIIIFPNNYYYRLELPLTLPLAIWDATAVTQVLRGLPDPSPAGRWIKHVGARVVLVKGVVRG